MIQSISDEASIDRLPPHSHECEQAFIGCQMIDPSGIIPQVISRFDTAVDFHYDLRHQTIQRSVFTLFESGIPVSLISIQQHLRDSKLLDQIGGIAYLNEVEDSAASSSNWGYYAEIIEEKQTLRRMISFCSETVCRIYESSSFDGVVEWFESEAMKLRRIKNGGLKPIQTLVNEALLDIEEIFKQEGRISGLSTGLPDLDSATDGLHGGEFIIIAAYPSVGKTSLAMNVVEHVALEQGLPVGVFSAEMSARSLVRRALCSDARVSLRKIRMGFMQEHDFPKLTRSAVRFSESKLHIDDSSDLTISQVRARARRMVQQFGVKLIVGDYAQLFSSPNAENRTNELDQISKGFKAMAKELDVPVILLSQLNDDGKLKGARAFGEDADGIWKLSRAEEPDEHADGERINLLLEKQRNEQRGIIIPLTFLKPYTRFESAAKISDADVPERRRNDH